MRVSEITTHDVDNEILSSYDNEYYQQNELNWLRAITNRQKAKIEELNEGRKMLSIELAQLKDIILNEMLMEDLNNLKREYVFLLQSCIKISLDEQQSIDALQVKLLGSHIHKKRVINLLNEARAVDPTLPTFESLTLFGNYLDIFGFQRSFADEELALHYICTQLYALYLECTSAHLQHRIAWKRYLYNCNYQLCNKSEIRMLIRTGVPGDLRPSIWKLLIHQQIADIKKKFGKYYFRDLCNTRGSLDETEYRDNHQKQITLDLLRTLPGNIHFMSPTCKGIQQLEQVLRAFCLHNPIIGYCQGMNFIAGTAMLFLGVEDTFWFLVAVTEKYFDKSYFDYALTGAQADQEVLKELVARRLPRLAAHLEQYGIDLATVTLNWFLALFYDAVPFQTMIRIWDCFLLDGTKVLFRFALAILSIHEKEVLQRNDTISVIKILKASVRLTYDYEGLFNLAFDTMQSFPSRSEIEHKQKWYLDLLRERLNRKEQLRKVFTSLSLQERSRFPTIEVVTFSKDREDTGFICAGHQTKGIIIRFNLTDKISTMDKLDIEFDCKIFSMALREGEIAYVSLLSGYIVALQIKDMKSEMLWELKISDIALKLLYKDELLYAALASGVLTIFENVNEIVPNVIEMLNLPISTAPVTEMNIVDDTLWLATACKVTIICMKSLTTLRKIYVASSVSVHSSPMFEKIRCMCPSSYGVWIATAHSQVLQLWKDDECILILDLGKEQYNNAPQRPTEITSVMCVRKQLWIGTVDGYLLIYHIIHNQLDTTTHPAIFLPSKNEMRYDESAIENAYRFISNISRKTLVKIDRNTRKYSVFRKISLETTALTTPMLSRRKEIKSNQINQKPMATIKSSLNSSSDTVYNEPLSKVPMRKRSSFLLRSSMTKNNHKSAAKHWWIANEKKSKNLDVGLASSSISHHSLEYDDLFEIYSKQDKQGYKSGKVKKSSNLHNLLKVQSAADSTNDFSSEMFKLRRKDLEFDEFIPQKESNSLESDRKRGKVQGTDETKRSKITLVLEMKLKISDKQVRCSAHTRIGDETIVVTCAGDYGDMESILKWTIDRKVEDGRELWVNDPIVDATNWDARRLQMISDVSFGH
ncbi:TBC domain containing protein [Brugia malayi]|uniref:TBC domain containing protein n=2 Tax=Brugia malayi TaxID=6279 RepID=A0A4E9EVM6_BRUMA|nr:TBC domain containing protein [Brugia malayi]VIO88174.1 TBC domain containing protein [Brugia malayi]